MKKGLFLNSGHLCPLLFFLLVCFSCKYESDNTIKDNTVGYNNVSKQDTMTISVSLTKKSTTGFNVIDNYFQYSFSEFSNDYSKDTVIVKKRLKNHKSEVIFYKGGLIDNGKIKSYQHYYLALEPTERLNFKYTNGDVILEDNNYVISVDDLYNDYKEIDSKIFSSKEETTKENLKKELDSIFSFYKKKYEGLVNGQSLNNLNYVCYLANLQGIYPGHDEIESYLKQSRKTIACSYYSGLLYTYAKNRVDTFNYKKLNLKLYSQSYLKNISIGLFNFLRYEGNKGGNKFQEAIKWLKTSDLYFDNPAYVSREITPLNNEAFRDKLKNINLLDASFKQVSFSEILESNPSDYYLLDFWATWCKPCIEGIETMKKMKIPKSINILSLSLDKAKDKSKWKIKTNSLEQEISYLIESDDSYNKEFLKFLQLQSIPRYILIDNNLNLIDESFFHPNESQFLPNLVSLKHPKFSYK